jgi:hypothetical protein
MAFSAAFSSRLTWNAATEWQYCAGQYWPAEYRAAAVHGLRAYIEYARPRADVQEIARMYQRVTEKHSLTRFMQSVSKNFFDDEIMREFGNHITDIIPASVNSPLRVIMKTPTGHMLCEITERGEISTQEFTTRAMARWMASGKGR